MKHKNPFVQAIKNFIFGNIYTVLLWRLAIMFLIYMIMRVLFYGLNYSIYGNIEMDNWWQILRGGYRFDKTAIFYLNIPIILMHSLPFKFRYKSGYQTAIKYIFLVVNSIGIIVNMADSVYYRFTMKRTTMSVFKEFENDNKSKFLHFIWDYWYITLIVIVLILLMIWLYSKTKVRKPTHYMPWFGYYPIAVLLFVFIGYQTVGGLRGGWTAGTRPITLSNANAYISKPEHRAIVLNTPFALMRTIGKTVLQPKNYFTEDEAVKIFSTEQKTNPQAPFFGKFKGRNVVIIIWESFAREWVGALNKDIPGYKGYTPFIDSLIAKSYAFKNAYANGDQSIAAMPSILASIPTMENTFITSNYSGNQINSVASLLKNDDYHSAFFHGAPNGSMGFDAFVKQAGFQEYYGMTEYDNDDDFDGNWGIWDEPFLQFMANKIGDLPQPFLATVFTLSSHDPFEVPEKYEGVFPKGHVPNHQCIGYTDNALRQFFDTASKQEWFKNTLFVITADHSARGYLPEYKNAADNFAIPLIFYAPDSDFVHFDTTEIVQQCDVLPTVLALLGKEKRFISFGNNIFDPNVSHFAISHFNGAFQLQKDGYLLQLTDDKTTGFYDRKTDRTLQHNLVNKSDKQQDIENTLKSIIQQFNRRQIDNKMRAD